MSMIICDRCDKHVDSDFHDVYFQPDDTALCEACDVIRELEIDEEIKEAKKLYDGMKLAGFFGYGEDL